MLNNLKIVFKGLLPYVLVLLVGLIGGAYFTYSAMNGELVEAKERVAELQSKYETTIEEREKAKIELAMEKLKEPEKVYIQGEDKVEYVYVEKTSKDEADVKINAEPQSIKISYNGEEYDLPMQRVTDTPGVVDGSLSISQKSSATLDVTDIVNREIANTILQKDAEIEKLENDKKVLERQKTQQTIWGVIGGLTVGYLANN